MADELHGFDFERARLRTEGIFDTTLEVLRTAVEHGSTPAAAADHVAEARMAAGRASRPGGMWLPDTAP